MKNGEKALWVAKVVLLIFLKGDEVREDKELAYMDFMEVTDAVSGLDRELGCVFLCGATEVYVHRAVDISQRLCRKQVEVTEYYGIVPFNFIVKTIQVLGSNIAIRRFAYQLACVLQISYLNRFLRRKAENCLRILIQQIEEQKKYKNSFIFLDKKIYKCFATNDKHL